jgi:hypothetical protein
MRNAIKVTKTGKDHWAGLLGVRALGFSLDGVSSPEESISDRGRAAVDEKRSSTLGNHFSAKTAAKQKPLDNRRSRMADRRGRSITDPRQLLARYVRTSVGTYLVMSGGPKTARGTRMQAHYCKRLEFRETVTL